MFSRPLLADAGLNQYPIRSSIDEETVHIHPDAVLIVGWTHARPEVARHNAKHRTSIQSKLRVRNDFDAIIAKLHGFLFERRLLRVLRRSLSRRAALRALFLLRWRCLLHWSCLLYTSDAADE